MTTEGCSSADISPSNADAAACVRAILAAVCPLAAEYYALQVSPWASPVRSPSSPPQNASVLARTAGYDAVRQSPNGPVRIQIKGRACTGNANRGQRIGRIELDSACDVALLVLRNTVTLH